MAKKILEDFKIKKGNIKDIFPRDVNIDNSHIYKEEIISNNNEINHNPIIKNSFRKRLSSTPKIRSKHNHNNNLKIFIIIICISILCGSIYFISNLFLNANIEIFNKHQSFLLDNKEFTASKDVNSPIHFEIMIVPNEETKSVILTQTQDVSIKAIGDVTLYNEYSTKAQNLAIHTYLADSDGKTYTINNAVSIPGYKKDGNKIIPGSVKVGITAFLPGAPYNGTPTDFIISSFKGTDKAKKIYAKTTTPITGGAQGVVYSIGQEDKDAIDTFINSSFKNNLIKKATALVPSGYILYPNSFSFSSETNTDILSEDPKANIKISGVLSTIILKESDLSSSIIKSVLPDISSDELNEIKTPDISNLIFNFSNNNQVVDKDIQNISFKLSGSFESIWNPNIDTLKTSLVGVPKINISSILKQDPGITSASISIFPPWQSNVPNDLSRIKIFTK